MGRKRLYLTGQRFGKLTVIRQSNETRDGRTLWECKCDCGSENVLVLGYSLKRGNTKSCGCLRDSQVINLTGQSFGRLNVIKQWGHDNNGQALWECKCSCGTENVIVGSGNLRNGFTKSCGCYRSEKSAERARQGVKKRASGKEAKNK